MSLDKTPTGFGAHLDGSDKPVYQPRNRTAGYANTFDAASSRYNPNEILADLFSGMSIADTLNKQANSADRQKTEPFGPLRTMAKSPLQPICASPEVPTSQAK